MVLAQITASGCARDEHELTAPSDQAPSLSRISGKKQELDSALSVHRRHTERLMATAGTVGNAVGVRPDGRPVIKIFLKNGAGGAFPTTLEGIPVDAEVTGEIVAMPCTPSTCLNTDVWPLPVPIGVSTGSAAECSSGTIGARVKAGTAVYALSNNHVIAGENNIPVGTNVMQPGIFDAGCSTSGLNLLGTLSSFHSIAFCAGSCPNNTMDAAIAVSTTTKLGRATPPAGYGTPKALTWPALVGLPVKKYGRTTSLTTGIITGINASIDVTYGSRTARFINQIVMSGCPVPCIRPGDSGSLLVSNDASANPIGLLFAGNTSGSLAYGSPIGVVLSRFGITVDGNPASVTASGGLTATRNCGLTSCIAALTSVTASGNTITVRDNGGHVGTIVLSGATASGGLTATPNCGLSNCTPAIHSVIASGSNAITVRDNMGHVGTITLSGTTASGGLTATKNCGLSNCLPVMMSVTGPASNGLSLTDNGGHAGAIKFQ
jgi:hypothetical protein